MGGDIDDWESNSVPDDSGQPPVAPLQDDDHMESARTELQPQQASSAALDENAEAEHSEFFCQDCNDHGSGYGSCKVPIDCRQCRDHPGYAAATGKFTGFFAKFRWKS